MEIIKNDKMPQPNGHYAMCIAHHGLLYLSGQLPKITETQKLPDGIQAQTLQALNNVLQVVEATGSTLTDILQVRIYLPDIALWDQVNGVYAEFFGAHTPVRSVIPSRALHFGALIEIEAIAVHHG